MIDHVAFWDMRIFAIYMLGEYVTSRFGKHHEPIFNCIPRGERGQRINILAPRGSAKTTAIARNYILHCLYFKEAYELIGKADNFIVMVSETMTASQSRLKDLQRIVASNFYFGWIKGDETWGSSDMVTSNDTRIIPRGREGQIRGELFRHYRPSLVACDDIDNAESVKNPDMREKNLLWFDSDLAYSGDDDTNIVLIETLKHEEAIASELRKRPGWKTLFFRAIEHPQDLRHPTAEGLWEEWEGLYARGENAAAFYEEHEQEMIDGVKELWPSRLTYLSVRKDICDKGYFPVMRELQNETRDPSQEIFDMDSAIRFDVTDAGLMRSDEQLVRWERLTGASVFLDWAGAGDSAKSCYAAVATILWEERLHASGQHPLLQHHGYVWETWFDRCRPAEQIEQLLKALERVKGLLVQVRNPQFNLAIERYVDTTSTIHTYVQRVFDDLKDQYRCDVELQFHPRFHKKDERILTLDAPIKNGWLAFNRDLPEECWREFRQYPQADYLDIPDAVQGATELIATRRKETELDEFGRPVRTQAEVMAL